MTKRTYTEGVSLDGINSEINFNMRGEGRTE